MININFNNTKSSMIYSNTQAEGFTMDKATLLTNLKTAFSKVEFDFDFKIILKIMFNIILILCFPLGLKIYEIRELNALKLEKTGRDSALSAVQAQLAKLKKELAEYDHIQEKSEEFANKKELLKKIAASRLIIPKTVALIQDKVPQTVWLESLKLKLEEDGNTLQISGKSYNETYVNSFATSLHDILDRNSITVNTRDLKEGGSVVKVGFELKGVM